MKNIILLLVVLLILGGCKKEPATGVKLANIYGENMVLQRQKAISVHGTASPKGKVTVMLGENSATAIVGKDSTWKVELPPMSAGGPYTLHVFGKDTTLIYQNILIGDVWIASGQSNMVWKMSWDVTGADEEIAGANYPGIRFITIDRDFSRIPRDNIESGNWVMANPDTVGSFSAVAYYFAKKIHLEERVPIGIVVAAIGGSTINGWIADGILQTEEIEVIDTSMIESGYDDSNWGTMILPAFWESAGYPGYNGYMWLRKRFDLEKEDSNKDLVFHLGKIDDRDVTWLNGKRIGSSRKYNLPREYMVDDALLNEGLNTLVVRVLDESGKGGLWGPAGEMYISDTNNNVILDLSGEWKYNKDIPPQFPLDELFPAQYSVAFNAMVNPFTVLPAKGIIWYQGEADAAMAPLYEEKMKRLITSWREEWKNEDLPFLYVQLPNYKEKVDSIVQQSSEWAALREVQKSLLSLPNTGMAVTIDVGEAEDVHPKNKKDVGTRLALAALNIAYDDTSLVYSGPMVESYEVINDTIVLTFNHVGSGLHAKDGTLKGFALVGDKQQFYEPVAWIKEDKVYLYNADISITREVWYGWADNPDVSLYNKEGLPAPPFKIKIKTNK
jgi:sialate O-acetylesterase